MPLAELLTLIILCEVVKLFEIHNFDYCDIKDCKPRDHTMCKYPPHKPDCDLEHSGLSTKHRKKILNLHNKLRQKVARGEEDGQPPAADMMKLSWNNEAEDIAQRWSERCQKGHDSCRIMMDGTSAGQNVAALTSNTSDRTVTVTRCFNSWYEEVKYVTNSTIYRFNSSYDDNGTAIGDYTALVNSKTKQIGCGYVERFAEKEVLHDVILVCNYVPSGNVLNEAVYKEGDHSTACPEGSVRSMRYPGLCTDEKDEYEDVPKRSWAIRLHPSFNPFVLPLVCLHIVLKRS
uniref:SCP domain-containing protein n=1 Tax=Homalodisca liturata TaxID=320908 RepID=A0A1B6JRI5_9HEMI